MNYKYIIKYFVIISVCFNSCQLNKTKQVDKALSKDSLVKNISIQDVKLDWEVIDTLNYAIDSTYNLIIYRFEGDYSKYGPATSILNLYNENSFLLWSDTLSTLYPDDIHVALKGNKVIIEKNESAISYHQYVIIDIENMKIIKSYSYDRDIVLKDFEYDSTNCKMNLLFIDLADSSLIHITEFEESFTI